MDKITDRDAAKAAKVTSVSKPLARDSLSIKINDHVVFYNIRNELIRGTAKWIGTDKSSDDVIVGIEVVSYHNVNGKLIVRKGYSK